MFDDDFDSDPIDFYDDEFYPEDADFDDKWMDEYGAAIGDGLSFLAEMTPDDFV